MSVIRNRETERLRAARELFQRAQADGVSMQEARARIHAERWSAINARLHGRAAAALCGTAAPAIPAPLNDDSDDGLAWWQR